MEFRVLGPLEVRDGERLVPLGGPKRRAVLGFLLLHANRVVPADRLIDALWGEAPPATAASSLQNHVSRLRRELGDRIVTRPPGYLVRVDADELDLDRFRRHVADARGADAPLAAERLRGALALWRGAPLADLGGEPAHEAAAHLDEERLDALERRIDADLALGRHGELVGELEALVGEHPFRERLWRQLVLGLYRCGRQADALEAYATARGMLVEELGAEPSPDLQELQRAVLRQDPALELSSAEAPPPPAAPAATREARKTVTVVVAELALDDVPSDPETRRAVARRAYDAAAEGVTGLGGTALPSAELRLHGVFGVPVAFEDDALRAVRSAFGLVDARLARRVGVATSEVITGRPAAGEPLVSGPSLDEAARLADAAATGDVVVSERTWRLVQHAVSGVPADGGRRLTRVEAGAPALARRPATPLIGRAIELAAVEHAFARAERERRAQLVTVFGDPGIGKSRLAAEAAVRLEARARCLIGRCAPHGADATYAPLREVVAAIAPGSVVPALHAVLVDEPDAELVSSRVAAAVGVEAEHGRVEETAWAVRRLLEAVARRTPLLLVLEDVQWGAPAFLDLVEHVVDLGRAPMLVLCLARPELLDVRPRWAGGTLSGASLLLDALSADESRSLFERLVPPERVGAASRERILDVAAGNPLFLEQLLAATLRGEGESIPDSIHALLAARLDLLGDAERAALEAAAVCGERFSTASVAELVGRDTRQALEALVRRDLVRPADAPLWREETWAFRHALIRDEAYEGIPKRRRAALHRAFADRLARLAVERDLDLDELVGYHLERAVRLREEIGELDGLRRLADEAARRLFAAGARAHGRHDVAACTSLLPRAADLFGDDAPERDEALIKLADSLIWSGESTAMYEALARARRGAERRGDARLVARATLTEHQIALWKQGGGAPSAVVLAAIDGAIEALRAAGDEEGLADAYVLQFHTLDRGQLPGPERALERALEHAQRAGSKQVADWVHSWFCITLPRGVVPVPDAIRRCEEILASDPTLLARAAALGALGQLRAQQGMFDEGRRLVNEDAVMLEELGQRQAALAHAIGRSEVEVAAGDLEAAAGILTEGLARLEELGDRHSTANAAWRLALVLTHLGRDAEAEQVLPHADAPQQPGFWVTVWRRVARARLLARRGLHEEARALLDEASRQIDGLEPSGMHVDAWLESALALADGGRTADAEALLARAGSLAEQLGYEVARARVREAQRTLTR